MRNLNSRVVGVLVAVLGMLLVSGVVQARPMKGRAGRSYRALVRTLERGASRFGRTRMAPRTISALRAKGLSVSLRPEDRVIVVARGFRQTGFFLNTQNKLSSKDSARLRAILRVTAPEKTSRDVLRSLMASTKRFKRREKRLATQDPLISSLLKQAARVGGQEDRVLWQGKNASLSYRPSTNTLVAQGPWSAKGIFLNQTAQGLTVQDAYREKLQSFLLDNAR